MPERSPVARFLFANPYNQHNYFTVKTLAELGDVFIICPPLELQFLFGRWKIKPRTIRLGFIPFCLRLWCTFLFLCLKLRLISTKLYVHQINQVCSIVAARISNLIWVHYQDYVQLSSQARKNIRADICELIIQTTSASQGWSATVEACSLATLTIAPNTQTLTPVMQVTPTIPAFVAPYGGDKSNFLQSSLTASSSHPNKEVKPFLISARANSYRKGLDVFLEALIILAIEYLSDHPLCVDFVICGHLNDRSAISHYRKANAALSSNPKIRLNAKHFGSAAYLQQLTKTDLFVMPSRSEGMSTAALEALWLGVPCILSRHCGIPKFVPDRHGFELNCLDPMALAGYMARCIDDNLLLTSFKSNLLIDKNMFTWQEYGSAYAKILSKIG